MLAADHHITYSPRQAKDSLVHNLVQDHWLEFLKLSEAGKRPLPGFVKREFFSAFKCGIHAFGFVRLYCYDCGHDKVVPFSCKRRGFCPSCCARRMNDTAAHLVDKVLPEVRMRQWVLSLPYELRFKMAFDSKLTSRVLDLFIKRVTVWYKRKARRKGLKSPQTGAITFIQRFGSALNLNVHFHSLFLDGVYVQNNEGELEFHPIEPPSQNELQMILDQIIQRVESERNNEVSEEGDSQLDLLDQLAGASIQNKNLSIKESGVILPAKKHQDLRLIQESQNSKERLAQIHGFSLHAGVVVKGHKRGRLEKLLRYMARGPLSEERLFEAANGNIVLELKKPWSDGTTHFVFKPLEFIGRLVSLVPPPRSNLVRYHGALAPNSKSRSRAVSKPKKASTEEFKKEPGAHKKGRERMRWTEMLMRVFKIDALQCGCCGGRLELIATLKDPAQIRRYLEHVGLPSRPPELKGPSRAPLHESMSDDMCQISSDW